MISAMARAWAASAAARAVATSRLALTADLFWRDMAKKAIARKVMTESISSVMTSATPLVPRPPAPPVAQVSTLRYRRLPAGKALIRPGACRLEVGDTADWKSALRTSMRE